MSDLFKSAFDYFTSSNNGQVENSFVNQIVNIGNTTIRVKKVIAEGQVIGGILSIKKKIIKYVIFVGGFAFVFVSEDVNSGNEYALKVSFLII